MRNKILILGDVHLGKSLSIGKLINGVNSRVQDQTNLLYWVLQTAKDKNVSNIIITGDIYEYSKPHPALIRIFMKWLKACEKEKITVHIIFGNHDIIRTGIVTQSALDIVPAVELPIANVYKDFVNLDIEGIHFTFTPYRDRRLYNVDTMEEALDKLRSELDAVKKDLPKDKCKVLIGHLALKGSLYVGDEIDDFANEIFCTEDMFDGFDYVWMGHIHKPQVLLDKDNRYIAHVGSMDRSDFGKAETDHDKIIVLLDSFNKEKLFENIVLPTRSLHNINITVPQDKDSTDFVINNLHKYNTFDSLKDSIVKVEVELDSGASNINREKVSNYLYKSLEIHNLTKLIEHKNISTISSDQEVIFDTDVGMTQAIVNFIDSLSSIDDAIKNKAKKIALERVEEYRIKYESA